MSAKSTEPLAHPAVFAKDVAARAKKSIYPAEFAQRMEGREKRVLGDLFGLTNFGVNLTRLAPGAQSALRHSHSQQDEFIYVVSGELVVRDNFGEHALQAGMCVGFKAGDGNAHHLYNPGPAEAWYLEVGDRTIGDSVNYPDDDLKAEMNSQQQWVFSHKDGRPY